MRLGFVLVILSLTLCSIHGQHQNNVADISNQIDSGNYYTYSNTQKATEFYTKAQTKAKALQHDTLLARAYVGFAVLARLEGDFPEALEYHQKSLSIHLRQGDQRFIAADYHNIGTLFRYSKDYRKAKKYLRKGIEIREAIQDSAELSLSYMQLGIVHRQIKQLDSATYYYDRAYQIANTLDDQKLLVKVNGNWAALEHYRGRYQRAIELNLADIPHLTANSKSQSLSIRYNNISRAYRELNNYPLAIEYMSKAIDIDEREGYQKNLYRHLLRRSTLHRKMEDYRLALKDYRRYKKIRDTVQNLERVEEFTAQKVAFDYQQQQLADSLQFVAEQERLLLLTQSERSKKNFYFLSTLLLLLTSFGIWYFWKSRKQFIELELEKQQLEGELLEEKLQNTQREAARMVAENQFRLAQKIDILEHLENLRQLSQDNRIIKELNLLATKMNVQLSMEAKQLAFEEDISQFITVFEERLIKQFPQLTNSERELCKLLRLDKSNQEIMQLRNASSASVRSMRYRVRKKMHLAQGEELEQFLKKI